MFSIIDNNDITIEKPTEDTPKNIVQNGGNYYSMYNDKSSNNQYNDMNPSNIDKLLENEKVHNNNDSWNKLDNISKKHILQTFSDKYGLDNGLSNKEIEILKSFFNDAIQKNKLKKTKEVHYNKETRTITNIPSLFFNTINRSFTLRSIEKRVSTLKSMTPKRVSNKNK